MGLMKKGHASFNFHFKGINELKVKLKKNADLELVKKAVMLNTSEMQRNAMRKAPYDTGHLMRSIGLALGDRGFTGHVRANADYAGYLEWGTRYMYAKPYMRPAYNEQKKKFKNDLKRLMG